MKLNWFIPIALLIPLRLNATDAAVGVRMTAVGLQRQRRYRTSTAILLSIVRQGAEGTTRRTSRPLRGLRARG